MSKVELRKARERDMKEVINEQEIEDATGFRGDPTLYLKRLPGKGFEKKYHGEIPSEFKGKLMYVSGVPKGGVYIYSDKLEGEVAPRRHSAQEIGIIHTSMDGKDEYSFFDTFDINQSERDIYDEEEIRLWAERENLEHEVGIEIAQMRDIKDIPSIDPSTNITDEINKLLYSYRIRPPPKPNPEQAEAIKNLRDINDIEIKDTSSNLKGDVNELMSLYGIR